MGSMAKGPGKVPYRALVWTGLAGLLAWRTFYHPARGVVADGYASQCPGKSKNGPCVHGIQITSFTGAGPVYAMVSGAVVETSPALKVASAREPVILTYEGVDQIQVGLGESVGLGQQIAVAGRVSFYVTAIESRGQGEVITTKIEPASWLAARGLRVSEKTHKSDATGQNWCEGGRKLVVPEAAGLCGMRLASPSGFMLLPVSVNMSRS